MEKRGFIFLASVALLALASCSTGSRNDADQTGPGWIRQPARTVDGGYIVYLGTGEDHSPERARFKAEALALEDLANECSFPPKGARVEDRFDRTLGTLHQSYVKVAVDFQTCEEAKKALDPAAVRGLASVAMTEEIKRYQDDLEDEEEQDASEDQSLSPETKAVLASRYAPPPPAIVNETGFFVVRQQVFYAKQEVILAPPAEYAPGAPQTTQYLHQVTSSTQQIQTYANNNPTVKTSPQTWTGVRQSVMRTSGRTATMSHPRGERVSRAGGTPAPGAKKRKKRRKGPHG